MTPTIDRAAPASRGSVRADGWPPASSPATFGRHLLVTVVLALASLTATAGAVAPAAVPISAPIAPVSYGTTAAPATESTAAAPAADMPAPSTRSRAAAPSKRKRAGLDHSGRHQIGWASYYARRFSGRKMADGTPMRPESDNAASRTLPLGTRALVTNLVDGKTALVTIRDRGPYVGGRIIDLSPSTARQLGILAAGVVRVQVTPISLPQPDGSLRTVVAQTEPEKPAVLCAADGWKSPLSRSPRGYC